MTDLRPLTQEERQDAYRAATDAVLRAIGPAPDRAQFNGHAASKYPLQITRLIVGLCIALLLAAFTPSAIRLYDIGSKTFGLSIHDQRSMAAVGAATILTAEIGQVVFSLALATLDTTKASRNLLYASMGFATTLALTGNIQRAMPGHWLNPFAWLEGLLPPLLVLSTAYVLKGYMLDSIHQRYENERAYQQARAAWLVATNDPGSYPRWPQLHANAIRDAIRKANARRKEALEVLTVADWRALVYRELQAESWYEVPEVNYPPAPLALHPNGNGHHAAN